MRRNVLIVAISALAGLLLSFGAAEAACTVPNTLTNGTTTDATQVMANFGAVTTCINSAPAGSTNALQYNAGSGAFSGVGPLTNGQIPIGSTGNAPQAATLTAGPGVTITNGPGSITISSSGGGSYTPPVMANFTAGNAPSGSTAADTTTGLAMTYPSSIAAWNTELYWDNTAYSGNETVDLGVDATMIAPGGFTGFAGLAIGDGTGKFVTFSICYSTGYQANVNYVNNYTSYNSNPLNVGLASTARFIRVVDDGTNFNFYVGADINSLIKVWNVARGAFIGTPTSIGLVVQGNSQPVGATFFDYVRTP